MVLACLGIMMNVIVGLLVMCPRCRVITTNLTYLPDTAMARNEITITFDDGPDPDVTPKVLDQLDEYGAKASFFCIGQKVAEQPQLVAEIIRRGHSVENHSYFHSNYFAFGGINRLKKEIEDTQTAITAANNGIPPQFFRSPFGFRSPLLGMVLRGFGIQHVAWTRRGFDAVYRNPDVILRLLVHKLSAGDILLLHDGASASSIQGHPVVLEVLPRLLEQCSIRNLHSVSLVTAFENEKS